MRTGVVFISSCACMDIVIVPSCTMFDRANSNVKLASSSRVKYTITGALESSTSTSTGALECEGSDLRVKLEYECSSFTH